MTLLFLLLALKSQTKGQILKQDFQSPKSYALEYVQSYTAHVHVCVCADPSFENVREYVTAFDYSKIQYMCLLLSSLWFAVPSAKKS